MYTFLATCFLIHILHLFNSVTLNNKINPTTSIQINIGSGLTFGITKNISL
jgi:hypothetical protein